jgi:riboflavin kinase/FMN adenylyltransferase
MPKDGVYATQILVDGKVYKSITNVGTRPTLDNGSNRTVETNIVGFNEEIYGKTVTVSFLRRLRDEIKFNNVEELKAQIEEDRKLL